MPLPEWPPTKARIFDFNETNEKIRQRFDFRRIDLLIFLKKYKCNTLSEFALFSICPAAGHRPDW